MPIPPKARAKRKPKITFSPDHLEREIEIVRVRLEAAVESENDRMILSYAAESRQLKSAGQWLRPQTNELAVLATEAAGVMGRTLRLQALIQNRRRARQWSTAELAKAANLPVETVCKAEMGLRQVNPETVEHITRILGITSEDIENV